MKRLFIATVLLTISLLLCSCGSPPYICVDPLGCVEISPGRPVVIGTLLTIYGSQGEAGRQVIEKIRTAIQENGEILGHEIKFIWQGTDCSEEYARLSATLLTVTPGLLAVIEPTCAEDARIAIPILEDAGLPLISSSPDALDAFQRLVIAIEKTALQQPNGILVIPRTTLRRALQVLP